MTQTGCSKVTPNNVLIDDVSSPDLWAYSRRIIMYKCTGCANKKQSPRTTEL